MKKIIIGKVWNNFKSFWIRITTRFSVYASNIKDMSDEEWAERQW